MPRARTPRPERLLTVAAVALLAACYERTLEPESVPLDEIIQVSRARSEALPLNAIDTIVARLPAGAGTRTVVFATSAGRFVENESRVISVVATRDSGTTGPLVARVRLRSDGSAAGADVSAAVTEYIRHVFVPFAP